MWEMKSGNRIYLNPGDFSPHTMKACTDSILTFPPNMYQGLTLPYQKIKVLELLLYLTKIDFTPPNRLTEYQFELIESIREIHDQLLQHMDQRITIEELSRQYLINPTTLKNAFKSVYGTSIAARIKNTVWSRQQKC